jgi:hypothetical protein
VSVCPRVCLEVRAGEEISLSHAVGCRAGDGGPVTQSPSRPARGDGTHHREKKEHQDNAVQRFIGIAADCDTRTALTQPSPGAASPAPSAGRRRPKAKYDSGPTPAELTSTAAMIHIRFEPRIWLAGRRRMSMSTAVLRTASLIAAAMISLRLLSLRSLHRVAMTPSASVQQP